MSVKTHFCPECGTPFGLYEFCQQCGYKPESPGDFSLETVPTPPGKGSTPTAWVKMERPLLVIIPWAWRVVILIGVVLGVIALILMFQSFFWNFLKLLFIGLGLFIALVSYKRYLAKLTEKHYAFIVNDVFIIGKLRFPKILAATIAVDICFQWWGGLLLFIPVLLLILFSPAPMTWIAGKVPRAYRAATIKPKKEKKASKPAPIADEVKTTPIEEEPMTAEDPEEPKTE